MYYEKQTKCRVFYSNKDSFLLTIHSHDYSIRRSVVFVEVIDCHDEYLFSIVFFVIYVVHLLMYEYDYVNVEFLVQLVELVAMLEMVVEVEDCKQVLELNRNCLDKDYMVVEDNLYREMFFSYHLHEVIIVV